MGVRDEEVVAVEYEARRKTEPKQGEGNTCRKMTRPLGR